MLFIKTMDNLSHFRSIIVTDVKLQLREVYHNLLELDRQIINYLNLIEYQSRQFLSKVYYPMAILAPTFATEDAFLLQLCKVSFDGPLVDTLLFRSLF